jgi:hypothetical protein
MASGVTVSLIRNLDARRRCVVIYKSPYLYLRKNHPVPIQLETMRAPEPVWMTWRSQKQLFLPGIQSGFLSRLAVI